MDEKVQKKVEMLDTNPVLYFFVYWGYRITTSVLWRLKRINVNIVPKTGKVIIAANHRTFLDPPLIGSTLPRWTYFLAKEELFRMPILSWALPRLNTIPLKRGSTDVEWFKTCVDLLEKGDSLVMFPEGGRHKGEGFGKARSGVGMIACHANAPVIPAYLKNSEYLGKFKKLTIIFGDPVMPNPPQDESKRKEYYQEFSELIMTKIAELSTKV
ncbi:MAG: lysophospholipid acyltransferase family protein [Elusimicrobiota bacterium]